MSPSREIDNTPMNHPDVQPKPEAEPFSSGELPSKVNSPISKSSIVAKRLIVIFPDAKVHSSEQAIWSNDLARGDSKRRND
ncbi:hypothetical protein ACHAPF_002991 [Botrytis cinerea]|uniref:Uncharacterized protein n=1 Tax=Botryotinia fuckeliana (strain T4) TaxID=999810 RepID=G2XR53_BOTF4|nr:predicted protein [Botrytis cinerea T4]